MHSIQQMLHFLIQLLSSKLKHNIPYSKIIPKPILCLHSDLPPWMRSDTEDTRPSINSRRKPERRVPITAPPTRPSAETTTTPSKPPAKRDRFRPETTMPEVSAAPVFYENHHGPVSVAQEGAAPSRDLPAATWTETLSSTRSTIIEEQQQGPMLQNYFATTEGKLSTFCCVILGAVQCD